MKDRESSRMSHWSPDCKNRMEAKDAYQRKAEESFMAAASAIVTSEATVIPLDAVGGGAVLGERG